MLAYRRIHVPEKDKEKANGGHPSDDYVRAHNFITRLHGYYHVLGSSEYKAIKDLALRGYLVNAEERLREKLEN